MTRASPGAALTAPAVARNREPILAVLRRVLAPAGTILEIASGTGEHAVHFAAALPGVTWQPSDSDPDALRSIAAHRESAGLPNLFAPLELDVTAPAWPVDTADAVVSINMIHIAPWAAAEGLMAGAARLLAPNGVLFLYGPFMEDGRHTAPSNAAFDESLRAGNPAWGVRDLGRVAALARGHGFELVERVEMPANNLSVVFRAPPEQRPEPFVRGLVIFEAAEKLGVSAEAAQHGI
jgi:SAM-dependent methyltransferase